MLIRPTRAELRVAATGLQQRLGARYLADVRGDPVARLMVPAGRDDPYPTYDRIRATGPLIRSRTGALATASHAVVRDVVRDKRFGVRPLGDHPPPPDRDARPVLGEPWDSSFLVLDPPDHTRLRRLAAPAFTPRRIAAYEPLIERVVHRLLDQALAPGTPGQSGQPDRDRVTSDGFDVMTSLASPLPVTVITELLGIEDADVPQLVRYGNALAASLDGIPTARFARELQATLIGLRELFGELIEARTREPGDDLVSKLVGDVGEERLTVSELLQMCTLLLAAGFETTVNLIGNGVHALLDHPEQWEALVADPESMAPRVVEETLRYDSPVQVTGRFAHEEVELAGHVVRPGPQVLVLLGGAGRDPEVFERPERFDLARENSDAHLSFSAGPHYCLGAALARLEGVVAFRALAERMPGLRRAGRPRRRRNITLRGLASLPVAAR